MTRLVDRGFKFRIYPNKAQQQQLVKIFGSCRFVYNHFLAEARAAYERGEKFSSTYTNQKKLTAMKKLPKFEFLKEGDSQALNQAIANLGSAYSRFFQKIADRPKFKKKSHAQSYTTFVTGEVSKTFVIQENKIFIPKLGLVKIVQHRPVSGRVTSGTISKTASGKYFISLHCQESEIEEFDKTQTMLGFDLGIDSFLTDQDSNKVGNPRHVVRSLNKLKVEQQKLQVKKKGSANYHKQRIKIAKLHEKVANQRKDFLHKLSHNIVKNHDFIAAESLDVKSMLEDDNLDMTIQQKKLRHRNIADVSWSEFLRQLSYKASWYGKKFIQIDQFFPSSQLCSACGYKNSAVKNLSIRKWTCPNCGSHHDRDHNAAINILVEARRLAGT